MRMLALRSGRASQVFKLVIVATPHELENLHWQLLALKREAIRFSRERNGETENLIYPHWHFIEEISKEWRNAFSNSRGFRCAPSVARDEEEICPTAIVYAERVDDILSDGTGTGALWADRWGRFFPIATDTCIQERAEYDVY